LPAGSHAQSGRQMRLAGARLADEHQRFRFLDVAALG
jgi:hypothetical protein